MCIFFTLVCNFTSKGLLFDYLARSPAY